ncbi:MAG TPA: hypothetical protein VER96_33850 [Polyangiaceae bacterium]|nr:hypothetical protein [Polyangiaceae bacterium]
MAKIVDVTDVPEFPGAGLLHFDDGRPPLMALPEIADEHRERLGIGDQRIADNSAEQPSAGGSLWDKFTKGEPGWENRVGGKLGPVATDAPPAAAPAAAPTPSAPVPTPEPPTPGPQGTEGAQPPPASSDPNAEAMAASDARMREALRTGHLPGAAPQPFTPAGFSPDSNKVVTERGPAYDTAAAHDRLAAAGMVLDAQMAKAASDKETADAQLADAAAKNLAAQQEAARNKAEIQRKQMAFQQQDARLQQDLAEYTESAKPDPNRYWSTPGGAFSGMLSIIGQGLGAFGATIGHTENWAFQAAQKKIQLEMAAQQEAFDAGRGDRKNALARLTEYYHGDIDMAKLALQQSLNKVAETETLRFGAQARSKDIAANAQVLAAQFQQQQLLNEQARADLAAGKTTTTSEEKYHRASGGGSGSKPLTLDQEMALRKGLGPQNPISAKAERKFQIDYGKAKEAEAAARTGLKNLAGKIGAVWDQKTGRWVMPKGKEPSVAGHGATGWVPNALTSQEGRDFRQVKTDVLSNTLKMRSGTAVTEDEFKRLDNMVSGTYDSDLLGGLNLLQGEQDAAAHERDAGYGADIVGKHNAERRGAVTKAQTDKAFAPEEPDDE